jgi:hypothetical protein
MLNDMRIVYKKNEGDVTGREVDEQSVVPTTLAFGGADAPLSPFLKEGAGCDASVS